MERQYVRHIWIGALGVVALGLAFWAVDTRKPSLVAPSGQSFDAEPTLPLQSALEIPSVPNARSSAAADITRVPVVLWGSGAGEAEAPNFEGLALDVYRVDAKPPVLIHSFWVENGAITIDPDETAGFAGEPVDWLPRRDDLVHAWAQSGRSLDDLLAAPDPAVFVSYTRVVRVVDPASYSDLEEFEWRRLSERESIQLAAVGVPVATLRHDLEPGQESSPFSLPTGPHFGEVVFGARDREVAYLPLGGVDRRFPEVVELGPDAQFRVEWRASGAAAQPTDTVRIQFAPISRGGPAYHAELAFADGEATVRGLKRGTYRVRGHWMRGARTLGTAGPQVATAENGSGEATLTFGVLADRPHRNGYVWIDETDWGDTVTSVGVRELDALDAGQSHTFRRGEGLQPVDGGYSFTMRAIPSGRAAVAIEPLAISIIADELVEHDLVVDVPPAVEATIEIVGTDGETFDGSRVSVQQAANASGIPLDGEVPARAWPPRRSVTLDGLLRIPSLPNARLSLTLSIEGAPGEYATFDLAESLVHRWVVAVRRDLTLVPPEGEFVSMEWLAGVQIEMRDGSTQQIEWVSSPSKPIPGAENARILRIPRGAVALQLPPLNGRDATRLVLTAEPTISFGGP
ncbi:MAG: hypothetical protein GC161_11075 [Planctomycetaceae bacterium]|nr:hypothetical protein [Planctomycetaceae bacterium]